jgi:hypothetical protein
MLFQQAYDKFENDTFKQALKTLTLDRQATNQGWSEISTISTKELSIERPEIFNPASSILSIKLLLRSVSRMCL